MPRKGPLTWISPPGSKNSCQSINQLLFKAQ